MSNILTIAGIVCEYNPFHNGHLLHIKKTREITNPDVLICVMSGNFVQRGEAAITNKWERAKVAVEHGVDLVIELPFIYATQSANAFAKAAIDILKLVNIDYLVFGSESNNLEELKKLASLNDSIEGLTNDGLSVPKAYEKLYGELNPNDILGLNYLKYTRNTKIQALTIQRTNQYHNKTLQGEISSATAIRQSVYEKKDYTHTTPMHHLPLLFEMNNYFSYIKTFLLSSDPKDLHHLFLMDEGIENNFIKNIKNATSYDEFVDACVSKRYTKAKIKRTIIHMINQTKKIEVDALPPLDYIRVLAFNSVGKNYLHQIREDVIIASKFNQIPQPYRDMELKAANIYAYPLAPEDQAAFVKTELQPPIYIKP